MAEVDPKSNPMVSVYGTMAGNPILYTDPLGDTIKHDYFNGHFNPIMPLYEAIKGTTVASFGMDEISTSDRPGTTRMDWLRFSGRTGRMESSRAIYDDYGRPLYRIDFSDHMRPLDHSVPHLHQHEYGPMSSFCKESKHNISE